MMSDSPDDVTRVLRQFCRLDKALIDASSIIYMRKTGFLDHLAQRLSLYSLPEIVAETGDADGGITMLAVSLPDTANDDKFTACARIFKWPVISEDRKILLEMQHRDIPYFNSLMMLNFCLFTGTLHVADYPRYLAQLQRHARYGPEIWKFGETISRAVISCLSG
jgi:hypothetical protein